MISVSDKKPNNDNPNSDPDCKLDVAVVVDHDENYKSCFARSMAVNSQYHRRHSSFNSSSSSRSFSTTNNDNGNNDREHLEQLRPQKHHPDNNGVEGCRFVRRSVPVLRLQPPTNTNTNAMEASEVVRLRKNSRSSILDDCRRLSCSSTPSSRRTSICSSRIVELPVENIVQQSKVDTLQWQLREIEKSREMYKAVMKQVVTFLEKAHRSLELLGTKMNNKATVSRSKSEHQIFADDGDDDDGTLTRTLNCSEDYTAFRDFTWRRSKKQQEPATPEEIPPDKLSQEAFRLLRTAQSLLNTQEPDLAQIKPPSPSHHHHDHHHHSSHSHHTNTTTSSIHPEDDVEFLAQLAKEFPPQPQPPETSSRPLPQRTTSFSMSPKLLLPEEHEAVGQRISQAFNRKLSLQLNETRRNSCREFSRPRLDSPRSSLIVTDNDLTATTIIKPKFKPSESEEKTSSSSPAGGSISSVEDESGFSSMTSFQDVGLPLVAEDSSTTPRIALLRSMLHNQETTISSGFLSSGGEKGVASNVHPSEHDVKLWQTPENRGSLRSVGSSHKRWSSTPAEQPDQQQQSMKVLWV